MTLAQAIVTIVGGFIFPFFAYTMWGKMVEQWGAIGGWLAALFVAGSAWTLSHGIEHPFIVQSGPAWVDMALAAGIGVLVASAIRGGCIKKASPNILAALVGGVLGGFILSLMSM